MKSSVPPTDDPLSRLCRAKVVLATAKARQAQKLTVHLRRVETNKVKVSILEGLAASHGHWLVAPRCLATDTTGRLRQAAKLADFARHSGGRLEGMVAVVPAGTTIPKGYRWEPLTPTTLQSWGLKL